MPLGLDMFKAVRKSKKNNDLSVSTPVAYPSGFLPLDYVNGQIIRVFDKNDNIIEEYDSIGFVDGTMITVVADSGLGKTTLVEQIAVNISSQFEQSFIVHEDIEGSSYINRVYNITGQRPKWIKDHYVIYQDSHAETILDRMIDHAKMKLNNRKEFEYDTGLKDLYGEKITRLVPTVVIIDSLAVMRSADGSITDDAGAKNKEDMDSTVSNNMHAARVAKFNSEMFKQILPYAKKANIIVFVINHINRKIDIGFVKSARDLVGLGENESIGGGRASLYLANNVLRLKNKGMLKADKDYGINGHIIDATFLKSRTSATLVSVELIFDKKEGFSPALTLLHYAFNNNFIKKKGNQYVIPGYEDIPFSKKTFSLIACDNPDMLNRLYKLCLPSLRAYASSDDSELRRGSDKEDADNARMLDMLLD